MFRSRRFSRRYIARPKRNAERRIRAGNSVVANDNQVAVITYTAAEAQTVKSIKLDCGIQTANGTLAYNVPYVLVRVAEGYNPNLMTYPALSGDMYNPTDQVLISGVLTDNTVEDHKYNMIGRKLKEGDRMILIFSNNSGSDCTVAFELSFTVLT